MQSRQAVQDMLQHGQTLRRREAVTSDAENIESDSDGEQMIHESTSRKVTLEDMEGSFSEDEPVEKVVDSEVEDNVNEVMNARADSERNGSPQRQKAQNNLQINPSQYLVVETQRTAAAANDDGEAKVALAFAGDDDVVAEFAAEKQRVVERERPKDIDLRLPGWGEWSGPGIKPRQRKKRSAILDFVFNFCCKCRRVWPLGMSINGNALAKGHGVRQNVDKGQASFIICVRP